MQGKVDFFFSDLLWYLDAGQSWRGKIFLYSPFQIWVGTFHILYLHQFAINSSFQIQNCRTTQCCITSNHIRKERARQCDDDTKCIFLVKASLRFKFSLLAFQIFPIFLVIVFIPHAIFMGKRIFITSFNPNIRTKGVCCLKSITRIIYVQYWKHKQAMVCN